VEDEVNSQLAKQLAQAKQENARLHEALACADAVLAAVLESVPIGIAVWADAQGKTIRINRYTARLFHLPEPLATLSWNQILAHRSVRLYREGTELKPDDWREGLARLEGKTVTDQIIRIVRGNGEEKEISVSITALFDNQGKSTGAVATFVDVTKYARECRTKKPGSQHAAVLQQAERLFSLGALVSGFTHEINNSLNSILMNAELGLIALERGVDAERLSQVLRRVVKDAKRGGKITYSSMQFYKADNYTPQGLGNLNDIISHSQPLMAPILQRSGLRLTLQLKKHLPEVAINRAAMKQVVLNFVVNAVQSQATQVEVSTASDGNHVVMTVRHNGIGLLPEEVERIFNTGDNLQDINSLFYFGLNLIRRIISDHGG
jgi:signal transduction histidine kinase